MSKRNTQQRRHSIITILNEQGEVSVDELSLRFETSEVTIRKDLAALEKTGLLLRRYGGAVAIPDEVTQQFSAKIAPNKLSIAKTAAQLLKITIALLSIAALRLLA